MKTLGLRDPAFLGNLIVWTPDETDANIWGWWSADKHITLGVGSSYAVSIVGDRCSRTVDKTDVTDTRNFAAYPTVGGVTPVISRTDTKGNLFRKSEDITAGGAVWATSNFTKNSATTGTFTAQNGYLMQNFRITRPGATYRMRAKLRAVSGNTNLHWYHNGSATGNSTAVVIDGTLKEYTVTFLGAAAGGAVSCGIQDQNAAGHGQIECQEWHLIENTWDTTYVTNAEALAWQFPTIDGNRCLWVGHWSVEAALFEMNWSIADNLAQPATFYLAYWQRYRRNNGLFWASKNPIWAYYFDLNPTDWSAYAAAAPFTRIDTAPTVATEGAWHIVTVVYNGANSLVRYKKDAPYNGNLGNITQDRGLYWGGDAFGGNHQDCAMYEFLIRSVADNAATQNQYIEYLARRIGITL